MYNKRKPPQNAQVEEGKGEDAARKSTFNRTEWKYILPIIFLLLFFLFFYPLKIKHIPKTEQKTPIQKPVYINRCPNKALPDPPSPYTRLPTLVILVHFQDTYRKDENVRFFLRHGLCEECENLDIYIVINGESTLAKEIPTHKNLHVIHRENKCMDFGAWAHVLDTMDPEQLKKYKRIMFMNDSVRGPFIDRKYHFTFQKDFHFTDIFASRLTNETRIVGPYISCGDFPGGPPPHAHVQSMAFMVDDVALAFSRSRIRCYSNLTETVLEGEIGISRNLVINHNINLGSMLYAYAGIDFRCNEPMRYDCNGGWNPYLLYFGGEVNPMEVVFYKTRLDVKNITEQYTTWYEQTHN